MKNDIVTKRLKNIAGHVRGIVMMTENDAYCIDIIRQIQAVQASLGKVNKMILENHLNSCVTTAIQSDILEDRQKVLKEIVDVFGETNKK
jgi:DNA-binding FrmR family transcriptional regulator